MISIDDYILKSYNMEINKYDKGGYFLFNDGTILIKYVSSSEHDPRKGEEKIAKAVNEKKNKGINTPAHLAVKRTVEDGLNVCWVLQEQAKGIEITKILESEEKRKEFLNLLVIAPQEQYDKLVTDMCELFDGLEIKPKNYFYDEINGFTFIDCCYYDIIDFPRRLTDELFSAYKDISSNLEAIFYNIMSTTDREYNIIMEKLIISMERKIPNFNENIRWIARGSYNICQFLKQKGYAIGDLVLNEKEIKQYNSAIISLFQKLLEKISTDDIKIEEITEQTFYNNLSYIPDGINLLNDFFNYVENTEDYPSNTNVLEAKKYIKKLRQKEIMNLINKLTMINHNQYELITKKLCKENASELAIEIANQMKTINTTDDVLRLVKLCYSLSFEGDIHILIASILRLLKIQVVYINAIKISDLMLEPQKDAYEISTFMEIKLNGKWYLLDPNKCFLYDAYNYESNVLPLGYYAYVKGVNKNDLNAKSSKYIKSIEDFFGNFYNFQDDYNVRTTL